ncbi:L-rhamnose mutarotase [Companilactobacillus sp. HBUAS56257]|uniref:L-rhamnose mutarotase n=1 Tax=Companilactobacillus sp. HBUAS56257 TaxID=3109360 RepID=UPI002FF087F3
MTRIYQKMFVNKSDIDEYIKRHQNIWEEMKQGLKEYGVSDYKISIDRQNGVVFSTLDVNDVGKYKEFSKTSICKKWWHYMAPIMSVKDNEEPITENLEEAFYLE